MLLLRIELEYDNGEIQSGILLQVTYGSVPMLYLYTMHDTVGGGGGGDSGMYRKFSGMA